jgi:hypothetical protein
VADPLVEFATLRIDGESYNLVYDFNAIAEAEKLAQCNLLHGIASLLASGATAMQLRGLLYAAMRKAHPKMTIDKAGELIRIDTMPDIYEALGEAYRNSMPEAKKLAEDPTAGGDGGPPAS